MARRRMRATILRRARSRAEAVQPTAALVVGRRHGAVRKLTEQLLALCRTRPRSRPDHGHAPDSDHAHPVARPLAPDHAGPRTDERNPASRHRNSHAGARGGGF